MVWAKRVIERSQADGRPLLVILDEAHNALNPNAATGRVVRILKSAGAVYSTATNLREAKGIDLYDGLFPAELSREERNTVLRTVDEGGEAAQESLTTMLVEDGVLLRREHDLSQMEFYVDVPPDEEIAHAVDVMAEVGLLVEDMMQAYARLRDQDAPTFQLFTMAAGAMRQEDIERNWGNNLMGVGSPIAALNTAALNALRAPMAVRNALRELDEGRKPLIAFQSTNEAVLREILEEQEEAGEGGLPLSFARTAARIHERIYKMKDVNGTVIDGREHDAELRVISERVMARLARLPEDLPVSPVDHIRDKLEEAGRSFGGDFGPGAPGGGRACGAPPAASRARCGGGLQWRRHRRAGVQQRRGDRGELPCLRGFQRPAPPRDHRARGGG